jgi:hypothetical protein
MSDHHHHPTTTKISARDFYSEFRGHRVEHLEALVDHLRNNRDVTAAIAASHENDSDILLGSDTATTTDASIAAIRQQRTNIIWTAGDSSLDNKYWFHNTVPAVSTYRHILQPPISKPDVTYWLNQIILSSNAQSQPLQPLEPLSLPAPTTPLIASSPSSSITTTTNNNNNNNNNNNITRHVTAAQQQQQQSSITYPSSSPLLQHRYVAVNGAVEASTLNIRTMQLLPQDQFIRDHIKDDDILIVSIGGNDVALLPLPCTIVSILCLVSICPTICTERGCIYGTVPMDDYCCGCGPSLWSCCCACPPCLGYFRHLFGYRVQKYIERLTKITKPSKIVVCMIYYPDEQHDIPTWADSTLQILGYNTNSNKLQTFIRKMYNDIITTIQIKDTEMIYIPLYRILDGTNTDDYVARVEPSVLGGKKMAEYIYANLFRASSSSSSSPLSSYQPYTFVNTTIPSSSFMPDRH